MKRPFYSLLPLVLAVILSDVNVPWLRAEGPRLPEGTLPEDSRLEPLRDLNSYFPFQKVDSPAAWQTRADQLRLQV